MTRAKPVYAAMEAVIELRKPRIERLYREWRDARDAAAAIPDPHSTNSASDGNPALSTAPQSRGA